MHVELYERTKFYPCGLFMKCFMSAYCVAKFDYIKDIIAIDNTKPFSFVVVFFSLNGKCDIQYNSLLADGRSVGSIACSAPVCKVHVGFCKKEKKNGLS